MTIEDDFATETSARLFDEREVRPLDLKRELGLTFGYLYDFGDDWHHTITFEQLLALDVAPRQASCVGGARTLPPEDVGGLGG